MDWILYRSVLEGDQREADRSLVWDWLLIGCQQSYRCGWYWISAVQSIWLVLDFGRAVSVITRLQADRTRGQELGTVCKG